MVLPLLTNQRRNQMSVFSDAVLELLSQYKQLLKKMSPNKKERERKLTELRLDYQYSRDTDEQLYNTISRVLADLKTYKASSDDESGYYHYSGAKKFIEHLEQFLSQYHLDNKNIVHCTQLASKYMIVVIQLTSLPSDALCSNENIHKLAEANQKIALYGTPAQHKQHLESLQKHRSTNPAFFDGMINNFNKALLNSDHKNKEKNLEEEIN